MQFTIPKFIEEEPKIIGPLTFKQFLFLAGATGLCALLYFLLPFLLFLPLAVLIMAGGGALAFLKIESHSLPVLAKNFFFFSTSPKIYLWKQSALPPKLMKKKETAKKKIEAKKESPLKIGEKSQLKKLAARLEMRQEE